MTRNVPQRIKVIVIALIWAFLAAQAGGAVTSQWITVTPGFNFVGFTVSPTAFTSANLMNLYADVVGVYRFDAVQKKYVSHLNLGGGDFDGTAISFQPGEGYILRATAERAILVNGTAAVAVGSQSLPAGFSIVSFPTNSVTSTDLMASDPAIVGVYRFDTAAKRYLSHLNLGGGDFDGTALTIDPGVACMVRTTRATELPFLPGGDFQSIALWGDTAVAVRGTLKIKAMGIRATGGTDISSAVTWTVTPGALATIAADGTLTAGATLGTVEVVATRGTLRSDTLAVGIVSAREQSLVIWPPTTKIPVQNHLQCHAQVTWTDGSTTGEVGGAWTLSDPTLASISTAGLFTSTGGTGSVTITYTQGAAKNTMTLLIEPIDRITLSVTSLTLKQGSTSNVIDARLTTPTTLLYGNGGQWGATRGTGRVIVSPIEIDAQQGGGLTKLVTSVWGFETGEATLWYRQGGLTAECQVTINP